MMASEDLKRKLTAIFSADVAGYSRLMGEDEEGTIRTLTEYREVISGLVERHRGRVVDSPGDNILAEFPSVVDAVRCAEQAQKELKVRNVHLPKNRKMEFRIGVNLGDVVEEGERIYGDGVNIAARIEGLADPGGICIAGTAFDQVKNKLNLGYEYLGEHAVKNISEPVRVYRVRMESEFAGKVIGEETPKPRKWRWLALVAGLTIVLVAGALAIWNFYLRPPAIEPASLEKMAYPLPDKPSIAVLPFVNMSDDLRQEYFSDGITEEIITALSKIQRLFVIARNSTFTYKGNPVRVQQVSEELGVRYVLEGSVRRAGDRVRITAQLIDALSGHHLWGERYDREFKDIFALQDEITMRIIAALQVKLTEGEQARILAKGTDNLDAYLKHLQGRELVYRFNKEDNALARKKMEEAIALDPQYAYAYLGLAGTHMMDVWLKSTESPKQSFARAIELAQKALALDDSLCNAHSTLGLLYGMTGQHKKALAECERAVALGPNDETAVRRLGVALSYVGRHEEAIPLYEKAIRLNPFPRSTTLFHLGLAHLFMNRCEEAITFCEKAVETGPNNLLARIFLTAAYGSCGHEEQAIATAAEVLSIEPKFSIEYYAGQFKFKEQDRELLTASLREAGLPEHPPLDLPDKPSIAVLPFDNLNRDPEQDYFSDGMTDDLITDLSKTSGLFVIARNSVFQYKGKPLDVKKISRELGVRYVLEGSVRRAEDRVRINAQLIDATTGGHLWADRYDGNLGDVFALQDKVIGKIVAALAVKLTVNEEKQITRRGTDNIAAYDAFLQGWQHYRRITRDDLAQAVTHFKKAIDLDPDYGRAHAALAGAYWLSFRRRWNWEMDWPYEVKCRVPLLAHEHLEKALKSPTSLAHRVASWMLVHEPLHEEAVAEAERAVALNPNDVDNLFAMARALIFAGRSDEGTDFLKKAMNLDPHYPAQYLSFLGLAQFCKGQLEEAAITLERAHKRNPELEVYPLVATYTHLGREEDAMDILAEHLRKTWEERMSPLRDTPQVQRVLTYYPFKNQADTNRFVDGLCRAGLPLKKATCYFALDPHCESAYELMAYAHLRNVWFGRSKSPAKSLDLAQGSAQKAIALDESSPGPRAVSGLVYLMKRQYEKAIAEGERAVALDPNNPRIHLVLWPLACILRYVGRAEEAIILQKKALDLDPWISRSGQLYNLGMAYFTARRYAEAISAFRKALNERPKNQFAYMGLAAAYTHLDREEDAGAAAAKFLKLDPNFSLKHYATMLPFKNQDDRDQLINALRKAGLK